MKQPSRYGVNQIIIDFEYPSVVGSPGFEFNTNFNKHLIIISNNFTFSISRKSQDLLDSPSRSGKHGVLTTKPPHNYENIKVFNETTPGGSEPWFPISHCYGNLPHGFFWGRQEIDEFNFKHCDIQLQVTAIHLLTCTHLREEDKSFVRNACRGQLDLNIQKNRQHKRDIDEWRVLKKMEEKDCYFLKADKSNTTVIIKKEDYITRVAQMSLTSS